MIIFIMSNKQAVTALPADHHQFLVVAEMAMHNQKRMVRMYAKRVI
jgi:hypothetical protein